MSLKPGKCRIGQESWTINKKKTVKSKSTRFGVPDVPSEEYLYLMNSLAKAIVAVTFLMVVAAVLSYFYDKHWPFYISTAMVVSLFVSELASFKRLYNLRLKYQNALNHNIKSTAPAGYDNSARPIWEVVADIGKRIPDEELEKLPRDLSVNLDHYLYGAPKKPQ
jgi:hypothetical protein